MWRLPGLLAALALALCAPAFAAPTADQAAQIKAIRDAVTALEGLQNPPPVVAQPPPVAIKPVVSATCAKTASIDKDVPGALANFQRLALNGGRLDCVGVNIASASWQEQIYDLAGTLTGPLLKDARANGQNVYWTAPILVNGTTWANAVAGAYDANWRQTLQMISDYSVPGAPVFLRIAPEFSGNWFPFKVAPGEEATFVKAWQRYVGIARAINPNFKFEWTPAILFGNTCATADPTQVNLTAAYPGDAYVDIVGEDPYFRTIGQWGLSPDLGWTQMLNAWGPCQPNLTWLAGFSTAHHKPMMLSEWGVDSDAGAVNVTRLAALVKSVNGWQSYFDHNPPDDILAKIDDGTKPNALAAYRAAFGQ